MRKTIIFLITIITLFFAIPITAVTESFNNLQNGSFEVEELYSKSTAMYKYQPQANVTHWNTTAYSGRIEIGWLSSQDKVGGTSPHMPSTTAKVKAAKDGYNFMEVNADELGSVYQPITLSDNDPCKWEFYHRGRYSAGPDTVAMIIGPQQQYSFDKKTDTDNDPFMQMISWLKESTSIEAPEANKATSFNVYTTPLSAQGTYDTSQVSIPFSTVESDIYTEEWQVNLVTTSMADWRAYRGTYVPKYNNIVMAFTRFNSGGDKANAGNLLDEISFKNAGEEELIVQSSFEEYTSTKGYETYMSANSDSPQKNIGWSTTNFVRKVEVGLLANSNAYGITVTTDSDVYVRDGYQFAELNADEESSLYQYVNSLPGKKYEWALAHRGRTGVDTMALVIGPKQSYDPKKPSATQEDQLMQIVGWIKAQTDVVIDTDENGGCTEKITMFTSTFGDNGTFTTDNPFSWKKDETHTEKWNVWLISSNNDKWYDYGAIDPDANYDYAYIVPEENSESIFGFVSYEPAPKVGNTIDYTYGNLLDCIQFDEYYHIKADTTPNGFGEYISAESIEFTADKTYSGWALNNESFRVVANVENRQFLGAIINGSFVDKKLWTDNGDGTFYYDVTDVEEHYIIRLIFAAEKVVYDVNGGNPYQYDLDDPSTGYEVPLSYDNDTYVSHAAESDKDGWKFIGWQYTNPSGQYLFDAVHTINYISDIEHVENDSMSITGPLAGETDNTVIDNIAAGDGVTMVAQWRYRQRAAIYTYNEETKQYVLSKEGGNIDIDIQSSNICTQEDYIVDGNVVGTDAYVDDDNTVVTFTAEPNSGYLFEGWYDERGVQISTSRTYSILVTERNVNTIYARYTPAGYDVTIQKTVTMDNGPTNAYFAVDVNITNAKKNTKYKMTGLDAGNLTTFDNRSVTNPDSVFTTNSVGSAAFTIYVKHGSRVIINHLPKDTVFSVTEHDYSATFVKEGEIRDNVLLSDTVANIHNRQYHNIYYKAVCPRMPDADFGSVSRAKDISTNKQGSIPTAKEGFIFKYWATKVDGKYLKVDDSMVNAGTNKLMPLSNQEMTYYAVFGPEVQSLTIEKSGCVDDDQTFIFDIKGDNGTDMQVTIKGNGSVTVGELLKNGTYTVTEKTDWSWRYAPQENNFSVYLDEDKTVSFVNNKTNEDYLDRNALIRNIYD